MRSTTSSVPARRARRLADRRNRRRPAVIAGGLTLGLVAAVGVSLAPASLAEASDTQPRFALASFTVSDDPAPIVTTTGTDEISVDVRSALADAEAAVAASVKISAVIEKSGLDVGDVETTVDTSDLEAAAERLEAARTMPAPLVPSLTERVTEETAAVDGKVDGLQERFEDAKERKAKQEAKAKAKRAAAAKAAAEKKAAEEAAAAEAAAAEAAEAQSAEQSSASTPTAPAAPAAPASTGGGASPAEAQAIAQGMLGNYGWGGDQFSCLVSLWNKESGWNYQAMNPSSGAYGIPQALPGSKMSTAGADWQTNAATQIAWGLGYIDGRYGSPCAAWSHSQAVNWY
ncbi:lytic transglycosylase domain-containing protein [Microbacterium sp. ARD31]|nr:lytic transglycosylase domain-containing protein [Microbacterium sp. ARD31]